MYKILGNIYKKKSAASKKYGAVSSGGMLYHQAFDNSLQANIISEISSGKIILVNQSACKLLGYSKKELVTKKRSDLFDIRESNFKKMLRQRTAAGNSTALVTAIKKNGSKCPCKIYSAIFLNEDGIKHAITAIADMRPGIQTQKNIDTKKEKIVAGNIVLAKLKQKKIDTKKKKIVAGNIALAQAKSEEKRLTREAAAKATYEENFKLIFNSSSDILYDFDLVTNKVIISDAYEKKFGYKITSNMTPAEAWVNHIHPDDKEALLRDYIRVLRSDAIVWKYSYRFLRADNSVANVLSNRIILRNSDGRAYRILGSMRDISKQKVLEEKLEQEIKLKEKQISEATQDAKETERSDIGKELHDNVNQLLGASKLYLDMAKQGGEHSEMYLSRSSEYTLTAIEAIRKLSKGLTTDTIKNLGLCESIESLALNTMEVNPVKISCALKSFKEQSVNDKFKLNIFRIVQEQLNNILKHAKAKRVAISLSQNKKSVILSISDNGVGFDTTQRSKGIGMENIKSRAAYYNGTSFFVSQPGQGCVLTVTFPVTDTVMNKSSARYTSS